MKVANALAARSDDTDNALVLREKGGAQGRNRTTDTAIFSLVISQQNQGPLANFGASRTRFFTRKTQEVANAAAPFEGRRTGVGRPMEMYNGWRAP